MISLGRGLWTPLVAFGSSLASPENGCIDSPNTLPLAISLQMSEDSFGFVRPAKPAQLSNLLLALCSWWVEPVLLQVSTRRAPAERLSALHSIRAVKQGVRGCKLLRVRFRARNLSTQQSQVARSPRNPYGALCHDFLAPDTKALGWGKAQHPFLALVSVLLETEMPGWQITIVLI